VDDLPYLLQRNRAAGLRPAARSEVLSGDLNRDPVFAVQALPTHDRDARLLEHVVEDQLGDVGLEVKHRLGFFVIARAFVPAGALEVEPLAIVPRLRIVIMTFDALVELTREPGAAGDQPPAAAHSALLLAALPVAPVLGLVRLARQQRREASPIDRVLRTRLRGPRKRQKLNQSG